MALLHNIWWYLVLIGVMILVHELGHYFAARFFDVKVETFSFGFGPRLFGFRRGETDFRFSAILFGGYVKMAGDQPGDRYISTIVGRGYCFVAPVTRSSRRDPAPRRCRGAPVRGARRSRLARRRCAHCRRHLPEA